MKRVNSTELKLLRALWRVSPMSAREIHEATVAETNWSGSATRKTLDRMEEKNLVHVSVLHGVKIYVVVQSKLETIAGLASAFAREVLEAETPFPIAAFSGSKSVTSGEIAELEKLLNAVPNDERGK